MLATMIALTILSVIILVIGFVWELTGGGEPRVQRGNEPGTRMMSVLLDANDEDAIFQRAAFKVR